MRLPRAAFYLFGMGDRRKMLYRDGKLSDALTGEVLHSWAVQSETIEPSEYRITLHAKDGKTVQIVEDAHAVHLNDGGKKSELARSAIHLPDFKQNAHAGLLRVLHHEILINIVNGLPVPNLWAYPKPWYRDGAMMMLCLERTGNQHLLKKWIMGLRDPFDHNNGGDLEPDNLGQALYLISCVSNASHPLVPKILETIPQFRQDTHLTGRTDGANHMVYQTKWLKFGLKHLKLADTFEIPSAADSYSSLFWMDYREQHVEHPRFDAAAGELYPYLNWAEAHFYNAAPPMPVDESQYPQTWEAQASQANYAKMAILSPEYVERKIAAPHSWHTAEMFLYYLDRK